MSLVDEIHMALDALTGIFRLFPSLYLYIGVPVGIAVVTFVFERFMSVWLNSSSHSLQPSPRSQIAVALSTPIMAVLGGILLMGAIALVVIGKHGFDPRFLWIVPAFGLMALYVSWQSKRHPDRSRGGDSGDGSMFDFGCSSNSCDSGGDCGGDGD